VRWPASDSVAIDRGSSTPVLGHSAYSASVICSITRACRVGVGSANQQVLNEMFRHTKDSIIKLCSRRDIEGLIIAHLICKDL